jgi:DNA-binding NarL/FixJ family response regulator
MPSVCRTQNLKATTTTRRAGPCLNSHSDNSERTLLNQHFEEALQTLARLYEKIATAHFPEVLLSRDVLIASLLVLNSRDSYALRAIIAALKRHHIIIGKTPSLGLNPSTPTSKLRGIDSSLSPREHLILRSMGCGHSNKRIAHELQISPETVKSHVKGIFVKLAAQNRAHAVSTANALGLL